MILFFHYLDSGRSTRYIRMDVKENRGTSLFEVVYIGLEDNLIPGVDEVLRYTSSEIRQS